MSIKEYNNTAELLSSVVPISGISIMQVESIMSNVKIAIV